MVLLKRKVLDFILRNFFCIKGNIMAHINIFSEEKHILILPLKADYSRLILIKLANSFIESYSG